MLMEQRVPLGEHVIRCFPAEGLLLLSDQSDNTLAAAQTLGPSVGCGSSGSSSDGVSRM
jgi:hypothetical protein